MKAVKYVLSWLFGVVVHVRNAAYTRGLFRQQRLEVPVISVGNISVGGTGKTPLVEHIAGRILSADRRVAVVSRGYRRSTKGTVIVSDGKGNIRNVDDGGDEPVQMARKLHGLVVIVDESRVRGCRAAIRTFSPDLIILDDAYQHRRCFRNLDIVVVDASRNVYDDKLLPAGRLREPLRNLKRADVVVLSRCDTGQAAQQLAISLSAYTHVPVLPTRYIPLGVKRLGSEESLDRRALHGKRVISFCGIGSPASFRITISMLGARSVEHTDFPDHHEYSEAALRDLVGAANRHGVEAFLTTEKDALRLEKVSFGFGTYPVYYPEMKLEFLEQEEDFFLMIDQWLLNKRQSA